MSSLSLTVFCFIFYHLLLNCNLQFDVVDIDESIPYILRKRRIVKLDFMVLQRSLEEEMYG